MRSNGLNGYTPLLGNMTRTAASTPATQTRPIANPIDASTSALERMIGAGSLDKAVEVQSDFVRAAYEGYVGQFTKVSEIVTDMAKSAYEPYEALFGKFSAK